MNTIISDFLTRLDQTGQTFIQNIYEALAQELGQVFRAILMLYVVWWGYEILRGRSTALPLEMAERLARVVFVYAVATQWSVFSQLIGQAATQLPENLGNLIVRTVGGASGSGSGSSGRSAVLNAFNTLYDAGVRLVGSVYTGTFYDIFGALLAAIILVAVMLFLGLALGILVASKLLLFITLALAPLFIILAVFGVTFRFTLGYLNLVLSLMISVVLLYAFMGFYIEIVNVVIGFTGSPQSGIAQKIAQVIPFIFVCICGFYVVYQIPSMAFAITGAAADPQATTRASLWQSRRLMGIGRRASMTGGRLAGRGAIGAGRYVANRFVASSSNPPPASSAAADAMRRALARNGRMASPPGKGG
jgi:type IV secretion system protein VirB6